MEVSENVCFKQYLAGEHFHWYFILIGYVWFALLEFMFHLDLLIVISCPAFLLVFPSGVI